MDELILPQYEITVGENPEDEENVIRTSLVDDPATQKLFAVFSNQGKNQNFRVILPTPENEQVIDPGNGEFKRIISGVWFMPDTDYTREFMGEFFTTRITRDNLKLAVSNFTKSGALNNFNVMHEGSEIEGMQTLEMWILSDYSQRSPIEGYTIQDLGYKNEDIPLGTALMSVYVSDEQFFNDMVLSGKVKGFSIEAFFNLNQKNFSKMKTKNELMFAKLGVSAEAGSLLTTEGPLSISATEVKLNGKVITDGEFKTSSNFSVVIRSGAVADFGFEAEGEAAAAAAATAAAETAAAEAAATAATEAAAAETVAAAAKAAEVAAAAVAATQTEDLDFDARVAAAIQADRTKRQTLQDENQKKLDADKKLTDALAEVEKMKKERDDALLSKPLVSTPSSIDASVIDTNTHRVVTRGNKQYAVPK